MKYEYNEELDKDALHLLLFYLHTETNFRHINIMKGVNFAGTNYSNLRYTLMTLQYLQEVKSNSHY